MLSKFSKCLLVFTIMIGILAPSVFTIFNSGFRLERNVAYAQSTDPKYAEYNKLFSNSTLKILDKNGTTARFEANIVATDQAKPLVEYEMTNKGDDKSFVLAVFQGTTEVTASEEFYPLVNATKKLQYPSSTGSIEIGITGLSPSTPYTVQMYFMSDGDGEGGGYDIAGSNDKDYYKFGKPVNFTTTAGTYEKVDDPGNLAPVLGVAAGAQLLAPCWLGLENGGIDIGGCIAWGLYGLIWVPSSILFGLTGKMLDYTMAYTIDSNSYKDMSFVTSGWKLVRDISNIFFILVLIYAGIMTIITGLNSAGTKRTIFMVVIVGVLLNFSLFFTQIIVDAGNILARTIYFNIQPEHANGTPVTKTSYGGVAYTPLSEVFVAKINPQKLIQNSQKFTDPEVKVGSANATGGGAGTLDTGSFILIILLASAINIVGLFVFFSVSMFLIGRVIGLWFAMIFSPLAFVSLALPKGISGKLANFGYDKWLSETLSLSFMAPVFVFFLYIMLLFLDNDFLKINTSGSGSGLNFLMGIIIPFVFIAIMLMKAKDIAKGMAGTIATQVVGGLNMVSGLALGAATGGAALVGRATVGAVGNKVANSAWLKDKAAGGSSLAKFALKSGTFAGKSTFDARKTKFGTTFEKQTGVTMGAKELGFLNLSSDSGKGGYKGVRDEKIKKYVEESRKLEVSDEEWSKMSKEQKDKHYETASESAVKNENARREKNKIPAMTEQELAAFKQTAKEAAEKKGKNTVNANRKEAFVESLKKSAEKGTILTTIGHAYSKGSIDNSAKILAAGKLTGEKTGNEKDQAQLDKIDRQLLKINGDPDAVAGSKEALGQEKILTEALKALTAKLNDDTALDPTTKMGGIKRHGKSDEENLEEETKHRQNNLNTADANLMTATAKYESQKTTTNRTAMANAKIEFNTRTQELKEIEALVVKKEKLENQREKLDLEKIDLENKKDTLLGKISEKGKGDKKEPKKDEEPKK